MKKVTLKDIAKELNVTIGTVSHALNDLDDISAETKSRVLETAKKLGYISNHAAVSLRSGRTNTIAIIVPDISNPYIANQIKLIEDKMKERKYSVIILNTNEDEKIEYEAIKTACSRQVDGLLLCPCQQTSDNISFLNKIELPYALIARYFEEIDTDYICADDYKSGYIAGSCLIDKGYCNPVFIGSYKYIQSGRKRFHGLKSAFEDAGIHILDNRFIESSPKMGEVQKALYQLLQDQTPFDSIVAFSDILAFETASLLRASAYKDTPIVGFDAILSHIPIPFPYASVGMVEGGLAEKASDIILKKINGSKEKFHEIIDVKLYTFP